MTVPAHIEAKARLAHEEDVMDRIAPLWEALPPSLQQRYIRIAIALHNATMREAVEVAQSTLLSADAKFDGTIKRGRNGERNLELAAAAAAGMSHAARKIATALQARIQETET